MSFAVDMAPATVAEPLMGSALEAAAREELRRQIGLRLELRSPTWRQLMFAGGRIDFSIPKTPDGVLAEIDKQPVPDQAELPTSDAGTLAGALLHHLQQTKPEGLSPRSVSPRKQLAPPRAQMGSWHRKIFLVSAGPECLRLLVAAGIAISADIVVLNEFYPKGLDEERRSVVEAAMALAAASKRTGHDADLPAWLNDQLFTVMGESRPTAFYGTLFGSDVGQPAEHGTIAGAPKSRLVDQTAPTPSPGAMS